MDIEDRSFVQAALRNTTTEAIPGGGTRIVSKGKGPTGPLDALDADNIERSRAAITRLGEWGLPVSNTGEHPRGLSLNISPNHSIDLTPAQRGWHIQINHADQYVEDPTSPSGYKYPEGWGQHKATLRVDDDDLPNAIVEHLTDPKVRKAAALDEGGSDFRAGLLD